MSNNYILYLNADLVFKLMFSTEFLLFYLILTNDAVTNNIVFLSIITNLYQKTIFKNKHV